MLDFLRKRKRSWVILIMMGVIVLVFAFYLGSSSLQQDPTLGGKVAVVNGDPISAKELELRFLRLKQAYRNRSQGIDRPNLRMAILDNLIQTRLLLQEAERLGLRVTDQELSDRIAEIAVFQTNDRFNKDLYLRVLRSQRSTPEQFEQEQRQDILVQKLFDIIRDSVQVTEAEVRERYRVENEKINLNFIRLSRKDYVLKAEVPPEELKSYYDQNQQTLREPTKVRVKYIPYSYGSFASQIKVTPKAIEDYYNLHRDRKFHQSHAVRLRHIFFRIPPGKDPKEKETIRAKAEQVLGQAQAGKDFAELAKNNSDDFSASSGGDTGFLSRGQILPMLEEAAFALKKEEISTLLESPSGLHIIKVVEFREEKTETLKEAETKIIQTLQAEGGWEEAFKAAEVDRQKAVDGTSFNALAKERKLTVKVTPFFRSDEGIKNVGPVDAFYTTSFNLTGQEISPVVEGPKVAYLIQLQERKESHLPALEALRGDVTRMVKEKKAMEMTNEKGAELLAELKETKDIQKVAKNHGLTLEETGPSPRSNSRIPKIGVLDDMQQAGIPLFSGQPIADQLYHQKDAIYLFAFKGSQEADMKEFDEQKDVRLEIALEERKQRALTKFVEGLRARAKIEVETESLLAS